MTPSDTSPAARLKTFVYLRRSQDREDRQSLSIDKQDAQLRGVIERNNLSPIVLPPEERSAKYPGRPIFNDMMDRIERGEARYIAVWALSRLSRNPIDGGRVIFALDTGKLLAIHTPSRVYRNTPDDKMVLAIELALAKKNNDDLSVQVKEGFEAKRRHGQYPGPAPLGYANAIIRPGERNIIPDPEKAPKVIALFGLAATGLYRLQDLWKEAQDMGLLSRSGKVLGKQTIVETLQRRLYTGMFKYGGEEWHKGSYEPLISAELFDRVQAAMGWAKSTRGNKTVSTSGRYYVYKGLLLCETCAFNVTAYTKSKGLAGGELAEYIFYTCTKKSKQVHCGEPQVSSVILEQEIKSRMSEYEISEADGAECSKWLELFYEDHVAKRDQYRPEWIQDQKNAQQALDTLDEKLERGVITDERYKTRTATHEETLARTTKLLNDANTDAEGWLELAKETFAGVTNVGEVFEMANDDERRRLMMFVGSNWYLGNRRVTVTARRPLDLLRKDTREAILADKKKDPSFDESVFWRARPDSNRRSPP